MHTNHLPRLLLLTVSTLAVLIPATAVFADSKYCDEWAIIGLGSVYLRSERLTITENEITWPGCAPAPYKTVSASDGEWFIHVPRFECRTSVRKDGGEGYILELKLSGDEKRLKVRLYDSEKGVKEKTEIGWGDFYRIPFDVSRNYFGRVGKSPISLHMDVSKNGSVAGYYQHDDHKTKLAFRGKIDGTAITLDVDGGEQLVAESFSGHYGRDEITGIWTKEKESLPFELTREPWEDSVITCGEMKKYPKKVFGRGAVDLGSGSGSPNDVDYDCQGGLRSIQYLTKLYDMAEQIRSEGPQFICSGSIVHAHWRYYHFDLLKAGLAPDLYVLHQENTARAESDLYYQNTLNYFKLWAHQSLYNFELYTAFWREYKRVKPRLVKHYKKVFHVPDRKAGLYAEYALRNYLEWAAGSFPSDPQDGRPSILSIEEMISRPEYTNRDVLNALKMKRLPHEMDQILKVALLYRKPVNILSFILKQGARIDSGDESALFFALRSLDDTLFLLRSGADVNYENSFGKTSLFYAVGFNDLPLVKILIIHNANVNQAYKSKKEIEEIEYRAAPFYQSYCLLTHTKRTVLMHAAQHADLSIIKLLLEKGARLDAIDEQGYNAADYALMGKKTSNYGYLESLGVKPNVLKAHKGD